MTDTDLNEKACYVTVRPVLVDEAYIGDLLAYFTNSTAAPGTVVYVVSVEAAFNEDETGAPDVVTHSSGPSTFVSVVDVELAVNVTVIGGAPWIYRASPNTQVTVISVELAFHQH